jgi:hypothetical protein
VWADGYGRLPQTLTEIASPSTPIILGFEQRAHKRAELASPTFIPTLHEYLQVQEVEFPPSEQREHLYLYHLLNTKSKGPAASGGSEQPAGAAVAAAAEEEQQEEEQGSSSGSDGFDSA